TVVHVEVVGSTQAVGGGTRTVIGHLRRTAYTPLTGVVQPGQTRFLDLVEGLVNQQYVTGQTRRSSYALFEVEQHVAFLALVHVGQRTTEGELVNEVDQRVGTVGLRSGLGHETLDATTPVTGDVVPDNFQTVLRDRERVGGIEVGQAVAVLHHHGVGGVALGRFDHAIRYAGATVSRVNRHAVALRITLEHGQLAGGQLVLVLLDVLGSDDEQRLIAGKWILQETTCIYSAGVLRQTTGPGRDGAVGIASHFRTQRSQGSAQLGGFIGRNRCHHAARQQGQAQHTGLQQEFLGFHRIFRPYSDDVRKI